MELPQRGSDPKLSLISCGWADVERNMQFLHHGLLFDISAFCNVDAGDCGLQGLHWNDMGVLRGPVTSYRFMDVAILRRLNANLSVGFLFRNAGHSTLHASAALSGSRLFEK